MTRKTLPPRVQAAVDAVTAAERLCEPGRDGWGRIEALKLELANLVLAEVRGAGQLPGRASQPARAGLRAPLHGRRRPA